MCAKAISAGLVADASLRVLLDNYKYAGDGPGGLAYQLAGVFASVERGVHWSTSDEVSSVVFSIKGVAGLKLAHVQRRLLNRLLGAAAAREEDE